MLLHTTFRQTVLKSKKYGSNRTSSRRLVPESMKWDPKKNDRVKATNHIGLSMLLASSLPFFQVEEEGEIGNKGSLRRLTEQDKFNAWWNVSYGPVWLNKADYWFLHRSIPFSSTLPLKLNTSNGICSFRMIGNDWELLISSQTFNITWRKEWLVDNNGSEVQILSPCKSDEL